jgi:sulfur-oxidizing protein SoxY
MIDVSIRRLAATGLAAGLWLASLAPLPAANEPDDPWPDLMANVFPGRTLEDGKGMVGLEMPTRAEDAAIVPVTMRLTLPAGDARQLRVLTLIVDRNPAPVAATFRIGPDAGVTEIATRVRIDSYTNVHAVAELSDGKLYMVQTYVKASGGCSAPAAKNAEEAKATIGQMRLRQFTEKAQEKAPVSRARREAQIMVRHPNHSGLQRDQITHLYVPAHFVSELHLWQGDRLMLSVEGGISISEDPNIRFNFAANGAATFRAEAKDTNGQAFKGEWPVDASGT